MRWPPASGGGASPTSLAELATRRAPSGFILPEPPAKADDSAAGGAEPTRAGVRNGPMQTPSPAQAGVKTMDPKLPPSGQPESHPGAFGYQGEGLTFGAQATSGQAAGALGKRKLPMPANSVPGSTVSPDV
jgi:hypothetical protein